MDANGSKDCIGDCWNDWRDGRFACAEWLRPIDAQSGRQPRRMRKAIRRAGAAMLKSAIFVNERIG
jgi:hypothetical protein